MNALISVADLLEHGAARWPQHPAYADGGGTMTYEQLARAVRRAAAALASRGVQPGERVAIYAPKRIETVVAMLAANALGAIFVPVNPQLKEAQIEHIVADSGAALFMTGAQRLKRLPALAALVGARAMLIEELADAIHAPGTDTPAPAPPAGRWTTIRPPCSTRPARPASRKAWSCRIATSCRAFSVAAYQGLADDDVVLGVLPLSFDAGLSQLTTALAAGACYAPLDFLQPAEVPRHCDAFGVTSITGVPPLWMQLASAGWSDTARTRIRCFANTGGHLATPLLHRLQAVFTNASPYLMYGLTEAFRSTYLPPADAALRPTSIGKAVPNAEILVLRADGSECAADEPGELVHRGAFVTLGYWNRPELTAQRFRPLPRRHGEIPRPDVAVWSGDIVRRDADGYLYFVARGDDMIKTSGYRVSPTEVEDVLFALPHIREAAVFGVPHASLGEAIAACVVSTLDANACRADIARACRDALPTYMSPLVVEPLPALPRNPNGKIDRPALKNQYRDAFAPTNEETAA